MRPRLETSQSALDGALGPDLVDEAARDSFPASDPPGWSSLRAGPPREAAPPLQPTSAAPPPGSLPPVRHDIGVGGVAG
jgi:hypothetical protein